MDIRNIENSNFGIEIHSSYNEIIEHFDEVIELQDQYKLLIFKNIDLSADQLVSIIKKVGDPVRHAKWKINGLKTHPEIYVLTNDKTKGQLSPEIWHIDQSFLQNPPTHSFLYSLKVAKEGGTTVFSDQSAVYRDLPLELKKKITGKVCVHEHATDYHLAAVPSSEELKGIGGGEPVYHPLVMPHWTTGENCLFSVFGHIRKILGMDQEKSDALMKELQEYATNEKYVYEHHWAEKDFLMWDNISLLHSARGTVDSLDPKHERLLWRLNARHTLA
jgi:taurine dioxygenase